MNKPYHCPHCGYYGADDEGPTIIEVGLKIQEAIDLLSKRMDRIEEMATMDRAWKNEVRLLPISAIISEYGDDWDMDRVARIMGDYIITRCNLNDFHGFVKQCRKEDER